jgi:hypothetical protein
MFVCYEIGVKFSPAILTFETGYQLLHLLRHPLFYFPFIRVKHSEAFHLQYSVQITNISAKFFKRKTLQINGFHLIANPS